MSLSEPLLSLSDGGRQVVSLDRLLRFRDPAEEQAFRRTRARAGLHVFLNIFVAINCISLAIGVVMWDFQPAWIISAMTVPPMELCRRLLKRPGFGHEFAIRKVCIATAAFIFVAYIEIALAGWGLDSERIPMVSYLVHLSPVVLFMMGLVTFQWLPWLIIDVLYIWIRVPPSWFVSSSLVYLTAFYAFIVPAMVAIDIQARTVFIAMKQLERENIQLTVEANPFSLDALRSWMTAGSASAPGVAHDSDVEATLLLPRATSATHHSSAGTNPWQIEFEELQLGRVVGVGGSGRVYQATFQARVVAVKELYSSLMGVVDLQEFASEVATLYKLRHPHILGLIGIAKTHDPHANETRIFLVTEFCPRVLADELTNPELPPVRELAAQLASGLAYMHAQGIVHRDLKPQNVLLTARWEVCVCDFGLAQHLNRGGNQTVSADTGTYAFMAPELMTGAGRVRVDPARTDVYSFGLVLWCMLAKELPYAEFGTEIEMAVAVSRDGVRPPLRDEWDADLVELVQRCWAPEPSERPGFAEISSRLPPSE